MTDTTPGGGLDARTVLATGTALPVMWQPWFPNRAAELDTTFVQGAPGELLALVTIAMWLGSILWGAPVRFWLWRWLMLLYVWLIAGVWLSTGLSIADRLGSIGFTLTGAMVVAVFAGMLAEQDMRWPDLWRRRRRARAEGG